MMKKFLYRFFLFSLLPLLTLLVLEIWIGTKQEKLLSEKKLEQVFRNRADEYQWVSNIKHPKKIFLLGSSSIKYGLSCRELNRLAADSLAFINLAADARDPIETYFILKQLDLSGVKAMYMGIDPWIYTRNYYRNRHQYLLLDLPFAKAVRYSKEYDARLFAQRYKALFHFPDPDHPASIAQSKIPADFGSVALTKKPVNFNDPVTKKYRLKDYGWSELQFTYLQKIVTLCESNGIAFTAFYPPRRSDFILDDEKNGRDIRLSFEEQLMKAGFNRSIHPLQLLKDDLFADAYHLNKAGQETYSRYFFSFVQEN